MKDRDSSPERTKSEDYDHVIITIIGDDFDNSSIVSIPKQEHFDGFIDCLKDLVKNNDRILGIKDGESPRVILCSD